MRNIKMTIQYDGSRYKGWQRQIGDTVTIQGKLESVIQKLTGEEIKIIGCGRTDTGVHADDYIANFRTNSELSTDAMLDYFYEFLPEDIVVKSLKDTSERFHARYNVISKTYVYTINNNKFRDVFLRRYSYHLDKRLDIEAMIEASKCLIGTHDFQSFTSLKSKTKSTVRTINSINIKENDGIVKIEVNGNGFLMNMVRIISGTLIDIGTHKLKVSDMQRILDEKKREVAGPIAQAKGLTLKYVQY